MSTGHDYTSLIKKIENKSFFKIRNQDYLGVAQV